MVAEVMRLPLPEPDDDTSPLDWYPGDEPESRTMEEVARWVSETLDYEDARTADHGAVVGVVVERSGPCSHAIKRERDRWNQRVYFFRCLDCKLIKIGFSKDYRRRRAQIERTTDHVLDIIGLEFGDRWTEAQIHGAFVRDRVQGEWFRESPELLEYIREHTRSPEETGPHMRGGRR